MTTPQHQKTGSSSSKGVFSKVKSSTNTPKTVAENAAKSKVSSSSNQHQIASPSTSSSQKSSSSSTPSPVQHPNFLAGTKPKVSDFEMIKTVGTGTFGVIKIAKHISTGKCVAIKCLNKQKIWDMKQTDHLKNEKNILFMVPHPRIVNLYGTMQDTENVYLIMEYISGGEIFSHLRQRQTFDMETTKYYIAQLVTAIAELHSKGIAYRDIKPENLLLDKNGQLKMTDFGFAKKIDDISFTLCGTPEYLAPELVLNSGHDRGVDWWAIGILMYEMLEGFPPFFGSLQETYQAIIQYAPCFTSITDPDAKELILLLLKKNKTKRLGCGAGGASDVMNHRYFHGVDWKRIEAGLDKAPIDVEVKDDFDTTNFDPSAGEEEGEEEEEDDEIKDAPAEKIPMDPKAFDGF